MEAKTQTISSTLMLLPPTRVARIELDITSPPGLVLFSAPQEFQINFRQFNNNFLREMVVSKPFPHPGLPGGGDIIQPGLAFMQGRQVQTGVTLA